MSSGAGRPANLCPAQDSWVSQAFVSQLREKGKPKYDDDAGRPAKGRLVLALGTPQRSRMHRKRYLLQTNGTSEGRRNSTGKNEGRSSATRSDAR